MQEGRFQYKDEDNADGMEGGTTGVMETMTAEAVNSPLTAVGFQLLHLPQCHHVL